MKNFFNYASTAVIAVAVAGMMGMFAYEIYQTDMPPYRTDLVAMPETGTDEKWFRPHPVTLGDGKEYMCDELIAGGQCAVNRLAHVCYVVHSKFGGGVNDSLLSDFDDYWGCKDVLSAERIAEIVEHRAGEKVTALMPVTTYDYVAEGRYEIVDWRRSQLRPKNAPDERNLGVQ